MQTLNDFQTGQHFSFPVPALTREGIVEFASEFDPQPFHLDEEAAKQSMFGTLASSGWHSNAVILRALQDNLFKACIYGGIAAMPQLSWRAPTYPDRPMVLDGAVTAIDDGTPFGKLTLALELKEAESGKLLTSLELVALIGGAQ